MQQSQEPLQQPDLTKNPRGIVAIGPLLQRAGFTEDQAAAGLGVDTATVRAWSEGMVCPPQQVVDALRRLIAVQERLRPIE